MVETEESRTIPETQFGGVGGTKLGCLRPKICLGIVDPHFYPLVAPA